MNNERALSADDLELVRDDGATPRHQPTAPPSPASTQQTADADTDADADTADEGGDYALDDTDTDGGDRVQIERQDPADREMDIPESAADYEIPTLDEREWSAADRRTVDEFKGVAHGLGLSNHEVGGVTDWFFKASADFHKKRIAGDAADRKTLNNAVNRIWGEHAKANRDVVNGLLGSMAGDFAHELKSARVSPNGPLLLNSPNMIEILRLAAIGRQREGSNARIGEGHADERRLGELKRSLKKNADKYFELGLDRQRLAIEERVAGRKSSEGPRPGDAAREKAIMKVMRSNFQKYEREGLSDELAAILRRRGEE